MKDKPQPGKQYRLTGGSSDKAISNGHSWAESEVKDQKKKVAKKMESREYTTTRCGHCGKFGHHHSTHTTVSPNPKGIMEKNNRTMIEIDRHNRSWNGKRYTK